VVEEAILTDDAFSTRSPHDVLGTTVLRWLREVDTEAGPSVDLHARVRDLMVGVAHAAAPSIDHSEVLDAVDEGLARSVEAVRAHVIDLRRQDAPGYVVVTIRRVALDRSRRSRTVPADPIEIVQVQDISGTARGPSAEALFLALREREDRVDVVRRAVRRLRQEGRWDTVRVVATWLDLADRYGSPPSLREVAGACGISHTSVRAHLGRVRDVLDALAAEDGEGGGVSTWPGHA
jgi:hypothetical protein